jgi:divalent metal cation (Fe/Co/Zn/Cd) transporter
VKDILLEARVQTKGLKDDGIVSNMDLAPTAGTICGILITCTGFHSVDDSIG